MRSLKNLKLPVESWDVIIIFILTNKLDRENSKQWEEYHKTSQLPKLEEFKTFLRKRADILKTLDVKTTNNFQKPGVQKQKPVSFFAGSPTCNYCKKQHMIYHCPDFLKLNVSARLAAVSQAKLCKNCLRTGHDSKNCKSGNCKERHNSLLHNTNTEVVLSTTISHSSQTLLSTAQVTVVDNSGNQHSCRAVLDCGSQINLMSKAFCKQLNLLTNGANSTINGIGTTIQSIQGACDITIKSMYNN